ncbi:threonyl-tRNA synthetase [Buchnera aphidicola str. Bp (Baizongia pistaciae)]|uniref:Threonine--tRNA ligase n=1 Tax=Buchnera aphidicola subsp. Baizongia pistaciae (strain Bp) TaxID=224915 RepID=SYT_BUCBP|nr:threonine--tRNA ligase [Buchnera aphidicola]P59554.1 RecName: Full=Threonine--tRNA ligase; AltName: Full=Threonyl-tRNA synthetase; Short=ThrRS [Buchnera aphidicola str. Bp (Baizongia pistaciae)]AAO26853.1 threonyl-tRNA synthetase [Buchnera aphidicola str. Bp (Baizongia pistaciae)]
MPTIKFIDGTCRVYPGSISVLDILKDVSPNSVQDFMFGCVNGISVDRNAIVTNDSIVKFVYKTDQSTLDIIRYSCICLLGKAVKKLWPSSKIGESDVLENGFFCDIEVDFSFNETSLHLLEACMRQMINKKYKIYTKTFSLKKASTIFKNRNETYKLFLLDRLVNFSNQVVSLCFHEEYIDIQKKISVPNIFLCRNFRLQKFSGVYWKGKRENKVLQRIYGTSWITRIQLEKHLDNVKKLDSRDHRKISKILDLYHIQEDLPGMIFWHRNGWIVFQELKKLIRVKLRKYNYQEVKTPVMMNKKIWKDSGHLDNYKESMFMVCSSNFEYGIKPMNCPGHVQIFNHVVRSYRDLPIRISEFGSCHRNEPSGALHGLMRIRNFTQDDAHIFCREDQICSEVSNCIRMVYEIYKIFGFKKILVRLSTRPKNRIGNDNIWDKAENDLATSLRESKIEFEYQHGEGAFYGPKIELSLFDSLGRVWQCATIQLDFCLPINLKAFYIDHNNERKVPIIVHRAVLGSIERFIGILIEEYIGNFPTWLAPIQVVLANVNSNHLQYIKLLYKEFYALGIRSEIDSRNETISYKIREHIARKIPYIIICGDKEVKNNTITLRTRSGKNFYCIDVQFFISKLCKEINSYSCSLMEE